MRCRESKIICHDHNILLTCENAKLRGAKGVTGNRSPSRSAGALGIVDTDREVALLQALASRLRRT
jgi:hypothetical protein